MININRWSLFEISNPRYENARTDDLNSKLFWIFYSILPSVIKDWMCNGREAVESKQKKKKEFRPLKVSFFPSKGEFKIKLRMCFWTTTKKCYLKIKQLVNKPVINKRKGCNNKADIDSKCCFCIEQARVMFFFSNYPQVYWQQKYRISSIDVLFYLKTTVLKKKTVRYNCTCIVVLCIFQCKIRLA